MLYPSSHIPHARISMNEGKGEGGAEGKAKAREKEGRMWRVGREAA